MSLEFKYEKFVENIEGQFFSKDKKGLSIFFFVNESELSKLIPEAFKKNKDEYVADLWSCVGQSWGIFEGNYKSGVPKCLGLLILQCLIVSEMKEDDELGANSYNPRLCEKIGVNLGEMQKRYRNYQEIFWNQVKEWANENDFIFLVPEKKSGKGMYVQYPFAQNMIRDTDFNTLTHEFEVVGLKPNLGFEDVIEILNLSKTLVPSKFRKSLCEKYQLEEYRSILEKRIYLFYQNWDGIDRSRQNEKNSYKKQSQIYRATLILDLRNYSDEMNKDDIELVLCSEDKNIPFLFEDDLFEKIAKSSRVGTKTYIVFEYDAQLEQGESVPVMEINKEYKVLTRNDKLNSFLEKDLQGIDKSPLNFGRKLFGEKQQYSIYSISFKNSNDLGNNLKRLVGKFFKFCLEGGLKLERRVYLAPWGPKLKIYSEDTKVYINSERQVVKNNQISFKNYPEGNYNLIVDQARVFFEIRKAEDKVIEKIQSGWRFSKDKYELSEEWDLGGVINRGEEIRGVSIARQYFDVKRCKYKQENDQRRYLKQYYLRGKVR